jgi:hypothetical protein
VRTDVGAESQHATNKHSGSQIERQTESRPTARHTGVVHEGVMKEVQDTMSCQRAGNKPQVALEPHHGGDREHCGDGDLGQQYLERST